MADQGNADNVVSTDSSPVKKTIERAMPETSRAAVGTTFQMRTELPAIPSTAVIGFRQTEIDDRSAGNFNYTVALLEKGAVGFWRERDALAPEMTPIEIDPNSFTRAIFRTLVTVLRRLVMKKTEMPDPAVQARIESVASTLAAGCCVEAYMKMRNLTVSDLPADYLPNRIRTPRVSDRLALPMGFAYCIQQLGIVNVADLSKEVIYLPRFTDVGHTTGIPNEFRAYWSPTAYAQAVEYARDLGMQFSVIDLKQKDGTAWWLFRQVYEDGTFELELPIPESNFTKSMVIAHSMFLAETEGDPSQPFVNLEIVGNDNFGVMLRNPHPGINVSCYESLTTEAPEIVSNV